MRPYRQIRTITGQKIFVRETTRERADRLILCAEIVLAPIIATLAFAIAGGMIRLG